MFLLDDFVLRALGISIPGWDFFWLLRLIRDYAFREMYNPEEVKDRIKENRMLYEFGELSEEAYREKETELLEKLRLARRVEEMNLKTRTDILNV